MATCNCNCIEVAMPSMGCDGSLEIMWHLHANHFPSKGMLQHHNLILKFYFDTDTIPNGCPIEFLWNSFLSSWENNKGDIVPIKEIFHTIQRVEFNKECNNELRSFLNSLNVILTSL